MSQICGCFFAGITYFAILEAVVEETVVDLSVSQSADSTSEVIVVSLTSSMLVGELDGETTAMVEGDGFDMMR
jgi:hypothetical protein